MQATFVEIRYLQTVGPFLNNQVTRVVPRAGGERQHVAPLLLLDGEDGLDRLNFHPFARLPVEEERMPRQEGQGPGDIQRIVCPVIISRHVDRRQDADIPFRDAGHGMGVLVKPLKGDVASHAPAMPL